MAAFGIALIMIGVGIFAVGLLGRLYASTHRPARGTSESPAATRPTPHPPRPRKAPPRPPAGSGRGPDGRSRIDGLTDSERERELKKLIKQFSKR